MNKTTLPGVKENHTVPLSALVAHDRNYKIHPPEQIEKLVASLERFGQVRSIVVQPHHDGKTYTIVAGHGVVEAARKADMAELRADILPASWTPEQVRGYLVADNLHAQGATDDEDLLTELLHEQYDLGYDLGSLGADDEMLRQMLAEEPDESEIVTGDGPEWLKKDMDERLDTYLEGTIRQVVLLFTPKEFALILARFRQIRELHPDLETNTHVVQYLVDFYVDHHQLPVVEEEDAEE